MLLARQEKVACRLIVLPVLTFTSSGELSRWASSDTTNIFSLLDKYKPEEKKAKKERLASMVSASCACAAATFACGVGGLCGQ